MSISDKTPPPRETITHLSEMDKAVVLYHSMGEDFIALLDQYLNAPPHFETFVFRTPDTLILGHRETRVDPHDPASPQDQDPYWYVTYAGSSAPHPIRTILQHMPYHLDRVAFARYAKDKRKRLRFLKTNKLRRYYGIST
jgi:hypothetical protein